ncbi:flavin reductase family protein [Pilimelia columellifera]|uniref:Flavin reductase family protein n=1 Tax=Pilimelia columellifera subsp. columellifera TaxID=706583 RepID=A0ABN3NB79_9ACTN
MTSWQPGAAIHGDDPFATPADDRSPARRMRGRLPLPVTLWTAGDGRGRAGLTVSSTMIADGAPGRVAGLVDPESELWAAVEAGGVFALTPLAERDQQLADRFAGLMPAPGGLFAGDRWEQTAYGPIGEGRTTWVGCRLDEARPFGWNLLVCATIERTAFGDGAAPLLHYRGRYRRLA